MGIFVKAAGAQPASQAAPKCESSGASATAPAATKPSAKSFSLTRRIIATVVVTQLLLAIGLATVAISYARQDAGAAEADIELRVDGFYAFVHQPEGWPHRICAPARSTRTHH